MTLIEASEKLADVERTRKKLIKAVDQVALLRKRQQDGEVLEANQLGKVNRYNEMVAELSNLDEKVGILRNSSILRSIWLTWFPALFLFFII